ncbi:unnamed protein product, partial [Porites evermanni]
VLPSLTRVKGLQVPGGAFADLLMLQEFVHNFGEALDLDSSEIPSLWEMQSSLLNESSEDVLVPLGQSLLLSALEDPGCEGPDVSCLSFLEWSNNILWVNKIHLKKMQKKVNHTSGAKLFSCHAVRIHLPTQMLLTNYVITRNLILGSLDLNSFENEQQRLSWWSYTISIKFVCLFNFQKHAQFRSKLFGSSHALRALCLGQDRYKRRYWILPHGGGIFVEGLETAEKEIVLDLKTEGEENIHAEIMKVGMEPHGANQNLKAEACQGGTENHTGTEANLKSPTKTALKSPLHSPTHLSQEGIAKQQKETFTASSGDNKASNTSATAFQPKLNSGYIPAAASRNAMEIQRIENLFKTSSTHHNNSAAQRPQETNSWFNLLPRMPCDESSLTLSHTHNSGQFVPTYSKRSLDTDIAGASPSIKRPPGRPPRISVPNDNQPGPSSVPRDIPTQAMSIQYLPQLAVKRPPGRPPKSSYQTINLTYIEGQPGGGLPTSTMAASTQSVSTMSLSFEELKKNVLESLMQEPAPIPPELQHGWWRITEPAQLKEIIKILHSRGIREKILQKSCQKYSEYANSSCTKGDQVESDSDDDEPLEKSKKQETDADMDIGDKTFPEVAFAVDKAILREVEEMEEKVFTASLQVKGWRLPPKASKGLSHNPQSETLLFTLKDRTFASKLQNMFHPYYHSNLKYGQFEFSVNIKCCTLAFNKRVPFCFQFCQICRKGDNEELLLLCDGCDRGYHTYCCTPKLSSIPEGDWYCIDCIVLAAGGDNCCMCGGASGKMAKCDNCPRNFHLQCLEPPLSNKPRKRRKIRDEDDEEKDDRRPITPPPKEEVRPHANRKQSSKDMAPCRLILAEMEKHEDAWPFLVPVNAKQFPEYYKIIKRPMDFHTMKIKLRDCQYASPLEFVDDARTVFLNCEEFNEDDSEVGQAGKRLFKFFEDRWEEVAPTSD